MQESYQIFRAHFPILSDQDIALIRPHSTIRTLDKKEYWQNGQHHYKVGFIVEGAIRAFYIDDEGKEITTILRTSESTIMTPGAIQNNQSKLYFSQAIMKTEIIEMPLPILLSLSQKNERIFQFLFLNIVGHFNTLMERVENLISLKPEDRVKFLLEKKSLLLETIPHKYVSDYIGITSVSLSRLLKKLS